VTKEDPRKLISQGEGLRLDFKKDLDENSFPDLPKDLAAFANAEGGTIVVGIDDGKHPVGVKWNERKSHRVQIAAGSCKPPVPVKITQDSLRGKKIVYIEIQKSTTIHSDDKDRFPQRFSDQTVFMDARTILLLATVRGMIQTQGAVSATLTPRRRPINKEYFLTHNLSSSNAIVRSMSLLDLSSLSHHVNVEKIPGIFQKIVSCLTHADASVRLAALELSERMLWRMNLKQRRRYALDLFPSIRSLVQPGNDVSIRARAFYLLSLFGREEALRAMLDLIAREPDESYQRMMNINNVVPQVVGTGLGHRLRTMVYKELRKNQEPRITARLTQLLEALRNTYWPE